MYRDGSQPQLGLPVSPSVCLRQVSSHFNSWGESGASRNPCGDDYCGSKATSEIEVKVQPFYTSGFWRLIFSLFLSIGCEADLSDYLKSISCELKFEHNAIAHTSTIVSHFAGELSVQVSFRQQGRHGVCQLSLLQVPSFSKRAGPEVKLLCLAVNFGCIHGPTQTQRTRITMTRLSPFSFPVASHFLPSLISFCSG